MKQLDANVRTTAELAAEVARYAASTVECDRVFGTRLKEEEQYPRHTNLSTLQGRIVRSCLLDMHDIVREALAPLSDFRTHMCFVTRNSIARLNSHKLTPSPLREYDGFDELKPQSSYLNDWESTPTHETLLGELGRVSKDSEHEKQVRSFRCFTQAYFDPKGTFALEFSNNTAEPEYTIIRSSNAFRREKLCAGENWWKQEDLDNTIFAFTRFISAKYNAHYGESHTEQRLYLIAVGSHALPRGLTPELAYEHKSFLLSTVQSAWIALSTDVATAPPDTLARLATTLPQIDSAMTSCLALGIMHAQEVATSALEKEKAEFKELLATVKDARAHFDAFESSIKSIFRSVEEPARLVQRFADELYTTVLDRNPAREAYTSSVDPRVTLPVIHDDNDIRDAFTRGHSSDIMARLKRTFGDKAVTRFLGHKQAVESKDLLWLKRYVYKLFAADEARDQMHLRFGMLRAVLLWRVAADENWDEQSLLRLRMADGDEPLVDDPREFIGHLGVAIQAWLQPRDVEERRVLAEYTTNSTHCTVSLSCNDSTRAVDQDKIEALARRIHDGTPGGSLTSALQALAKSSKYARPRVLIEGSSTDANVGRLLRLEWPVHADERLRCAVELRYHLDPRDLTKKSMILRFPN